MSAVRMALAGKVYPTLTASIGAGASNAGSGSSFGWGVNTCTPGGGSGNYSYSWAVSQGGGSWSLSTPLASTTNVSVGSADFGVEADGAVTCTVTDTVTGRTVTSNTANYAYTWNS